MKILAQAPPDFWRKEYDGRIFVNGLAEDEVSGLERCSEKKTTQFVEMILCQNSSDRIITRRED